MKKKTLEDSSVTRTREFPYGGQREVIPLIVCYNDCHRDYVARAFGIKAHYVWGMPRLDGRRYSKLIVFDPSWRLSDQEKDELRKWIDETRATKLEIGGEYYLV
jgi:hypothetical protein